MSAVPVVMVNLAHKLTSNRAPLTFGLSDFYYKPGKTVGRSGRSAPVLGRSNVRGISGGLFFAAIAVLINIGPVW